MATELKPSPSLSVATHASAYSRSVLIVRIGAMGDVLHAMPAVAALRQQHPEWVIGWAIEPAWSGLLQSSIDFNRIPQKPDAATGNHWSTDGTLYRPEPGARTPSLYPRWRRSR
ncbi:hypothetical protein RBB78_09950 [Tunturiibacter empetritectus]|uniref:glycosyltransferase family 9 protein n=1 Tax=Tunturiibacter empetritectus TaxID=3069691 RepID=UPI003D9B649C